MRTIQISESVFQDLSKQSENFETPSETIGRIFRNYQEFKKTKELDNMNKFVRVKERKSILDIGWKEYFDSIKVDPIHSFTGRVQVLDSIQDYFKTYKSFADMPLEVKQVITGLKKNLGDNLDYFWFGKISRAYKFKTYISENDVNISNALDHISLTEKITKKDFDNFFMTLLKAFPEGGLGLAVFSRLLSMKRPDWFLSLNGGNQDQLYQDFQVNARDFNKVGKYQAYWELISKAHGTSWYNSSEPLDEKEKVAHKYRMAMTDIRYYKKPKEEN